MAAQFNLAHTFRDKSNKPNFWAVGLTWQRKTTQGAVCLAKFTQDALLAKIMGARTKFCGHNGGQTHFAATEPLNHVERDKSVS